MKLTKALKNKIEKLREAQAAVQAYDKKHARVFNKRDELLEEVQAASNALKDDVRKLAPGGSKRLSVFKDAEMEVSVQSKQRAPEYDVLVAKAKWPAKVFKACRKSVIDTTKLAEFVEDGTIDEKLVNGAMKEREQLSAAVTVKFKK